MDATLAETPRSRLPLAGWPGRMGRAARFGLGTPAASIVALAGFLARGGFVLVALPIVVLPSPVAIEGAFAIQGFTIASTPTAWFIGLLIVAIAALVVWLLVAGFVGSLVDAWLVRAAADAGVAGGIAADRSDPAVTLLRLFAIRAAFFVPVAIAVAVAGVQIAFTVYDEYIAPEDLATPIYIRVIRRTAVALIVAVVVWLVCESAAAIAVRRVLLGGVGIWRSLLGTLGEIVRRPVSTLGTVVLAYLVSALATAIQIGAVLVAFGWMRVAARTHVGVPFPLGQSRDAQPLLLIAVGLVLAAVWLATLLLSGLVSALRSAAFTAEVADALGAGRAVEVERSGEVVGLSHQVAERSGD